MLLAAVNVIVFPAAADMFPGKCDLDGIDHIERDDIDLLGTIH